MLILYDIIITGKFHSYEVSSALNNKFYTSNIHFREKIYYWKQDIKPATAHTVRVEIFYTITNYSFFVFLLISLL